ncbi:unnamed protein product [Ostreobium quekettii]|uniref:NmrA-like domain-containing protein n=1 Tax=Ostreobium quekettii TaxID=121088 RepID=A0A8S1IWY9_9CHLO|nr:unnamed protein product [Ostreobium quekettii]|eukprot:evm.model.scf_197EXC.6 EVM.evm.TU.scf_197EXC.6   scf_197EXC:53168-54665(-)
MAEKLLVFGPAGNVGRQILPHVVGNPKLDACLAYHKNRPPQCDEPGVESVQVSLLDLDSVKKALSWQPDRIVFMVNSEAATLPMGENFVAACKAMSPNVKQIVYVSECDYDKYYRTDIAFYKDQIATVQHVLESGLPVTRIEPSCFMQNIGSWMGMKTELAKGTGVVSIGIEPTTPLAWVDTRDIADVVARVLEKDVGQEVGKHYRLVGDCRSMGEMTAMLSGVLKECESEPKVPYPQRLVYKQTSREALTRAMEDAGMGADVASDLAKMMSTFHEGHLAMLEMTSSEEMEGLLGRPAIRLEQYLRDNKSLWESAWASGKDDA